MHWALSEVTGSTRTLSWPPSRRQFSITTTESTVQADEDGVFKLVMAATGDLREYNELMRRLMAAQREFGPAAAVTFPNGSRYPSAATALKHLDR